jgi:hypothetical protein
MNQWLSSTNEFQKNNSKAIYITFLSKLLGRVIPVYGKLILNIFLAQKRRACRGLIIETAILTRLVPQPLTIICSTPEIFYGNYNLINFNNILWI